MKQVYRLMCCVRRPKQWQTGFHAFRSSVIKKYDFWNCHPVLYFAQTHTILECVTIEVKQFFIVFFLSCLAFDIQY